MHSQLQLKVPHLHIAIPTAVFLRMALICTRNIFASTTTVSDTRQASTPLLDYQPVCRRIGSYSEEDAPRIGLEVLRTPAERLPVVRLSRAVQ